MSEWTKGPWEIAAMGWSNGDLTGGQVHAMRPTGRYVKDGDAFVPEPVLMGTPICSFFTGGHGYREAEGRANARLISAAPDLADAALLAFIHEVGPNMAMKVEANGWDWPDDAPDTVSPSADALRAALQKARGK